MFGLRFRLWLLFHHRLRLYFKLCLGFCFRLNLGLCFGFRFLLLYGGQCHCGQGLLLLLGGYRGHFLRHCGRRLFFDGLNHNWLLLHGLHSSGLLFGHRLLNYSGFCRFLHLLGNLFGLLFRLYLGLLFWSLFGLCSHCRRLVALNVYHWVGNAGATLLGHLVVHEGVEETDGDIRLTLFA